MHVITDPGIINDPELRRQYIEAGYHVPKPRAPEPDVDEPVYLRTITFDVDGAATVGKVALQDLTHGR